MWFILFLLEEEFLLIYFLGLKCPSLPVKCSLLPRSFKNFADSHSRLFHEEYIFTNHLVVCADFSSIAFHDFEGAFLEYFILHLAVKSLSLPLYLYLLLKHLYFNSFQAKLKNFIHYYFRLVHDIK